MDFRKVFNDNVPPEEFDKWRGRYCDELFADLIAYAQLGPGKTALEIGPGTGQATEPILKTGCSYLAIELGANFTRAMQQRFGHYENFGIVNGDFETHDFGSRQYDLVYSAATIQWIPEEMGFPKVYGLLKHGGTFAMMLTRTDYRSPNEDLYQKIQQVYDRYFHPETKYTCSLAYSNVEKHGFVDFECHQYPKTRQYTADEYVSWIGTHADHITLPEPYRTLFYTGIRDAILGFGNTITLHDTIVLYLARKP